MNCESRFDPTGNVECHALEITLTGEITEIYIWRSCNAVNMYQAGIKCQRTVGHRPISKRLSIAYGGHFSIQYFLSQTKLSLRQKRRQKKRWRHRARGRRPGWLTRGMKMNFAKRLRLRLFPTSGRWGWKRRYSPIETHWNRAGKEISSFFFVILILKEEAKCMVAHWTPIKARKKAERKENNEM